MALCMALPQGACLSPSPYSQFTCTTVVARFVWIHEPVAKRSEMPFLN